MHTNPHPSSSAPRRSPRSVLAVFVSVLLVGACSSFDFDVTQPGPEGATLTLFAEVPASQVSASVSPTPSVRIADGQDVLNLAEVKIAVDQVEFGRWSGECTDSSSSGDDDACTEAVVSPAALPVPVDQQVLQLTDPLAAEPGTYDRLELDLHVVENVDQTLIFQEGFTIGTSVQVRGSFNGSAIEVDLRPERTLALELDQPISLSREEAESMTLVIDVASWFRDAEGNLVDPRVAAEDPDLKAQVEQNIVESFSATPGTPQ